MAWQREEGTCLHSGPSGLLASSAPGRADHSSPYSCSSGQTRGLKTGGTFSDYSGTDGPYTDSTPAWLSLVLRGPLRSGCCSSPVRLGSAGSPPLQVHLRSSWILSSRHHWRPSGSFHGTIHNHLPCHSCLLGDWGKPRSLIIFHHDVCLDVTTASSSDTDREGKGTCEAVGRGVHASLLPAFSSACLTSTPLTHLSPSPPVPSPLSSHLTASAFPSV